MSATLQAAVKQPSVVPYVELVVSDQPCERPRMDLTECYTGSEGDQAHAACVAGDGSIIRLRASGSGGTLYSQRVTNVLTGSQWSTWVVEAGITPYGAPVWVEVVLDAATGKLWRYCTVQDGGTVRVWYSTSVDHGVSWAGWAEAYDVGAGGTIQGLAASHGSHGDFLCVARDPDGSSTANKSLVMRQYSGGSWSTSASTGADEHPIDGVGLCLGLAGTLLCALYGSGSPRGLRWTWYTIATSTWEGEGDVLVPGTGSVVTLRRPRLGALSTEYRYALTWVETSTSPAYDRAKINYAPVLWHPTEEVTWNWDTAYGVEVLRQSTYWLIVGSDRAYRAAVFNAATSGHQLTIPGDRVRKLELGQDGRAGGRLVVEVDNSGGWYNNAGVSGAAACLRVGAQVGLKLGLRTTAGGEGVWQAPTWIESVTYRLRRGSGSGVVVIEARDGSAELGVLRARRAAEWSGYSLGACLERVWWRVCGRAATSWTGALSTTVPQFSVAPGERWLDVAERLLRMTGTLLRWQNTEAGGLGWAASYPDVVAISSGSSVWSIGGSGEQVVLRGEWRRGEPSAMRIEVHGDGYYGDYRAWAVAVKPLWRETSRIVRDEHLDSQAEVDDRASYEILEHMDELVGGRIVVYPIAGLEIGDVVTVTEAGAGLSAASRTVMSLRTRLDRVGAGSGRVEYEQEIRLGG